MSPTEVELSKSSVNCMPRGLPAIWLQNPYSTYIVHNKDVMAQLYEVLNNWRLIHLDGRPVPKDPEPWFHGNSATHWDGDTLVVESTGFRGEDIWLDRKGSPLTDAATIIERIRRVNFGRLETQLTINDAKAYTRPFTVTLNEYLEPSAELMDFVCVENDASGPQFLGK